MSNSFLIERIYCFCNSRIQEDLGLRCQVAFRFTAPLAIPELGMCLHCPSHGRPSATDYLADRRSKGACTLRSPGRIACDSPNRLA